MQSSSADASEKGLKGELGTYERCLTPADSSLCISVLSTPYHRLFSFQNYEYFIIYTLFVKPYLRYREFL